MQIFSSLFCYTIVFFRLSVASVLPRHALDARGTVDIPTPDCTNTPKSRQCWDNAYTIETDSEIEWPITGKTVSYHLEITNITFSPDGTPKQMMAINGQFPGPTISANWGDVLQITVLNSMQDNGTSMHWHGITQTNSNEMDGVNGITECPVPPGQSRTYTFLCNQHGTSWYHSHFSAQYGDGVVGPIVIDGPATANYDIDLGALPFSDLYYDSAWAGSYLAETTGPPTADNGVINGTMVSPDGSTGAYNRVTLQKGKSYRLRLINTSLDNHFKVSLDSHSFTVIAADFVPIVPYNTTWLFLAIGQRYDVIIDATADIDNYWFRAEVQQGCGTNANNGNILSVFSYEGASPSDPSSTATNYTQSCDEETQLVPYISKDVPKDQFVWPQEQLLTVGGPTFGTSNLFTWNINGSIMDVDWERPTLQYVLDSNTSYPTDLNIIELSDPNVWTFWIIQSPATGVGGGIPHPIHLHGHDFSLLGSGTGNFTDASALQFQNPPRRDVAMLPGAGWLVIGFETDNPGAWLLHCHIAWHVSEGLALQFLERPAEIKTTLSLGNMADECTVWDDWYKTSHYKKDDSGL